MSECSSSYPACNAHAPYYIAISGLNGCTVFFHIIIFITIFLHGLGRLTCSGIDALPSFPGASAIPSSPGFVGEGVFRQSGVVFLSRWLIQFCLYFSLTSCIPEISSSCLMSSLLILSNLVYPVTLLRKRISAASRRVMSLFAARLRETNWSSKNGGFADGLVTLPRKTKYHIISLSLYIYIYTG